MNNNKTYVKPFSNGTEAMMWQERNCLKCEIYECKSQTEEEARCIPAFYIDMGFLTGVIPTEITKKIFVIDQNSGKIIYSDCTIKSKLEL
jgi:hypothetical protein